MGGVSDSACCCSLRVKKVEETQMWVKSKADRNVILPLTFLDIPWLLFPPTQPLFFFQVDEVDDDFNFLTTTLVPKLKHSLSSALHHFFPLASRLTLLPSDRDNNHHQQQLQFLFSTSNCCSVPLTVAVAEWPDNDNDNDNDTALHHHHHHHLWTNQPRDAAVFHLLVPRLPTFAFSPSPLLAIQITYFPKPKLPVSISNSKSAFSIGFACHPVICDQRTFHLFLTTWASFCKHDHPPLSPSFDRSVILDPTGLDLHSILLKQCLNSISISISNSNLKSNPTIPLGMLRATFVMAPTDIHNTRLWILAQCDKSNTPYPVLLSPYVVTCALVWACFAQAHHESKGSMLMYLGFIAGGISRLSYHVPANYFGNCVAFGRAVAKREDLLLLTEHDENGIDGILVAAHAIAKAIKDLDADVLEHAQNWIPDWEPILGSDLHINVVGSPKVELYKTDFGWGTPNKIEEISIDGNGMRRSGVSLSLMQSRDFKGGIEIGITLPNSTMQAFSSLFNHRLSFMSSFSSSSSSCF